MYNKVMKLFSIFKTFYFFKRAGVPTPKQNTLKQPQNQYLYFLKCGAQSVKRLPRS